MNTATRLRVHSAVQTRRAGLDVYLRSLLGVGPFEHIGLLEERRDEERGERRRSRCIGLETDRERQEERRRGGEEEKKVV